MKVLIWYSINIQEKFRKLGYGSALYASVDNYARENDIEEIVGNAIVKDTSEFFAKIGFKYVKDDWGPFYKKLTKDNVFVGKKFKGVKEEIRITDTRPETVVFPMDKKTKMQPRMIEWRTKSGELIGKAKVKAIEGETWEK